MRVSHLRALLALAIASLPMRAHADDAILLIKSTDILSAAPKNDEETLVGKTVWIGNEQGARGSAVVQLKPHHPHDAILDQNNGPGLFLGYTTPTQFAVVTTREIVSGPTFSLVTSKLRELGTTNPQDLEGAELAVVDLNGDGRADSVVSAHPKRNVDDTSSRKPGDAEAIFLVTEPDGQPEIIDQIVDVLAAGAADPSLARIDLHALAQDPATGNWNLLVSEEHRVWKDETTTIQVTIGGQTTQQTTTDRVLYRSARVLVYELKDRRLSAIYGLRSWLLSL